MCKESLMEMKSVLVNLKLRLISNWINIYSMFHNNNTNFLILNIWLLTQICITSSCKLDFYSQFFLVWKINALTTIFKVKCVVIKFMTDLKNANRI